MFKLFVYGTLKPNEINYQRYCAGKVLAAVPAMVYGQLYALPVGYPALVEGSDRVYGTVLSFQDPQLLAVLDVLEGYDPQRRPEQNDYQRECIEAYDGSGKAIGSVWVYRMTRQRVQQERGVYLPTGVWSRHELTARVDPIA